MADSWRLSSENQSICSISHFCRGKEEIQKEKERIKNGGQLEIISREPEYLLD